MISNLSKLVNEAGNTRGNVQQEHTNMNTQQSKDIVVYVGADISKDTIDISYHFSSKLISDKIAPGFAFVFVAVSRGSAPMGLHHRAIVRRPFRGSM